MGNTRLDRGGKMTKNKHSIETVDQALEWANLEGKEALKDGKYSMAITISKTVAYLHELKTEETVSPSEVYNQWSDEIIEEKRSGTSKKWDRIKKKLKEIENGEN